MLKIDCPWCGPSEQAEFHYGGQAHLERATPDSDEAQLAQALFMRTNTRGIAAERWFHASGCRRWFNALRDTVDDRFIASYKPDQASPPLMQESPDE